MLQSHELLLKAAEAKEIERELRARLGGDFLDWASRWSKNQRAILTSTLPFNFAFGGNGSGKTTLGSWWTRAQLASFNPINGSITTRVHPVNMYCVGNTFEKLEGVMKPALRRWLPAREIEHEDNKSNIWHLTEGRRVLWKTGQQDVTTFTGDDIDACWIDEELSSREHFNEVLARLVRRLGVLLNTVTPALGTLWLHNWVFSPDEYPMEEKRICTIPMSENPYYSDCDLCAKPRSWHEPVRMKGACPHFSNDKGQKKLERARRQFKGIVFRIRFNGEFLLLAGNPVIPPDARTKMQVEHERPPVVGCLTENLHFSYCKDPDNADDVKTWLRIQVALEKEGDKLKPKILLPEPGHSYVMGVDVGGGNPMGDYHAAIVIDVETGEQVALAHTRGVECRDFGQFAAMLGTFYNDALAVIEINNHGVAVFDRMIELGYANLYRRQRIDSPTKIVLPRSGFFTDVKSKPAAVDLMVSYWSNRLKIHDPIIIAEAFHYTWLKERREGTHGIGNSNPEGHDDCMSALFLCAIGLKQLGWGVLMPGDELQVERPKTIGDQLIEDSAGRELSEQEILEGAIDPSPGEVADVFEGGGEEAELGLP